jgi:ribose transport system substrate-binding protein
MKKFTTLFIMLMMFVLTACGGSDTTSKDSSPKGDTASSDSTKKVAFFSAGASNNYLQTGIEHAEKVAEEFGWELDVFDGKFDPLAQLNQVQNAIAQDKYDGFVVEAVDGNQLCKVITEDAVGKGIAVSAINIELCGEADNAAEGTLTFVGGQGVNVYQDILNKIFEENPEGGKIAVIGGPATGTPYLNMKAAVDSELPKNKNWELVGPFSTDYTANEAFQVAQNVLQSNKDLDVIFSNYSGMTAGVVEAKNAAKRDDVKIYDFGGDKWAFDAVEKGDIQQTVVMLPKEEIQRGLEALRDHWEGKDVPPFYDLTKEELLPGSPYVDLTNIEEFNAKGLPEY